MRLAETTYDNSETGCCAPVDRERWDDRTTVWEDAPFLKDHVRAVAHIPLNFGAVIGRDQAKIKAAAAWPEHPLTLSDEVSAWGSDLYIAVDREVPDAEIVRLSGTFLSRVFEGPYKDIGEWTAAMRAHAADKGLAVDKVYYHYATCPKCAKALGRNEVVLFAQVRPQA
jgi:hypothetical protein